MLLYKQQCSCKFGPSLFLVKFFAIFVIFWNILHTEAASCLFNNDQLGQCVRFEDCPSAILLSSRGINPAFCNLEEGVVCCTDNIRKPDNGGRPSSGVQSGYSQNLQSAYSNQNNEHDYEGDGQRKKHSIGKPGGSSVENNYGKRKPNNEELYSFEKPSNSYPEINNKPSRQPNRPGPQNPNVKDDGYFIPPGIAKKKPWREEKTTENDYYYEHVTKKPSRGPNRKNPSKNENHNPSRGEDDSRGNEWSSQNGRKTTENYDWLDHPNEYDYSNQRPTTKRNKYAQDTYTTKRNEYSGPSSGGYEGFNPEEYYSVKPAKRPSRPSGDNFNSGSGYQESRPQENNRPSHQSSQNNGPNYHQESWSQENNQGFLPQGNNRPQTQQGSRPQGSNRPTSKPQRRRRISEQKCEEYSKQVTENITGLPLTTDPDPVIIPVRKCLAPQQLIVGGENTTLGEFPHMAAIGFRDNNKKQIAWNCGGTLISEQYVVTAAHCASTSSGRPVKVRLGEYNLMKNDDGAHPVDYAVVDVIIHPEYRRPSKYHDIALLKLSRRVTFFKHIRPACLYSEETFSVSVAIATGWGQIYYDGKKSEILQKVALNIVDNKTCNRLYKVNVKTEALPRGIIESQMCAGELAGGKDTCQGDSGGPLSITSTKCIHHIIGITSFGKSCALPNSTGVYTRVSAYLPWIESIVWPSN